MGAPPFCALPSLVAIAVLVGVLISGPAHADRRVQGRITDKDGQPLPGFKVVAWDEDGEAFFGEPPLYFGGANEKMGEDITDASGFYRIDYPRPHGSGPGGGHWDDWPHNIAEWRPDIFVEAHAPTAGFCEPASPQGPRFRYAATSRRVDNQRTDTDLRLDVTVDEFFDVSCGTFQPFQRWMEPPPDGIRGVVDMHAHFMSHLAFGGKLFHGAPDVGSRMLAGTHNCWPEFTTTKAVHALPRCNSTHGGHDLFTNTCGNYIRNAVLSAMESAVDDAHSYHGADARGWGKFDHWPLYNDVSHQKMWVDWVYRAFRGGLRVMVALSHNNETLGQMVNIDLDLTTPGFLVFDNAPAPLQDEASSERQVEELKRLVDRHTFMEIAYSPEQLRDIVGRGKLAIVVGVELDEIGDLGPTATFEQTRAELRELYDQGVRYVFPIHLTDNSWGGTAIYTDIFALSNVYQRGSQWDVGCTTGVDYTYGLPAMIDQAEADIRDSTGVDVDLDGFLGITLQRPPDCLADEGHANRLGLTQLGREAIQEMMRLGMIIDVDHMSERAVEETLQLAEAVGYPLNSGHNGPRKLGEEGQGHENSRTEAQYRRIVALGGMVGLGWAGVTGEGWLEAANDIVSQAAGVNLALGTDANSLVFSPSQPDTKPLEIYDNNNLSQPRTGTRKWDYRDEGVAHYGMMADFLYHIQSQPGGEPRVELLFKGAERFAEMWERSTGDRERLVALGRIMTSLEPLLRDSARMSPAEILNTVAPRAP